MMRQSFRRVVRAIALVSVVIIPSAANAQTCFRGKPLPHCRTFWVTEFTASGQVGKPIGQGIVLMPELGYMVNLNEKHAVGGSYFFDIPSDSDHPDGFRHGPKLRYRRWINRSYNVDITAGLMISEKPELAAEAVFNFRDWIGIGARVEFWRAREFTESQTAYYSALKIGGVPGVTLSSLLTILGVLAAVSIGAAG
jgi:hypothetical protein